MFADTATEHATESRARNTARPPSLEELATNVSRRFLPHAVNAQWVQRRRPLLQSPSRILAREEETLARLLSEEGRRPITLCRTEARRAVQTVAKSEEALVRLAEPRALDFTDALQGGHHALAQRFTSGPLFAIVPFNFPLNLALHKIAPALALGLPFVCKGPAQNPRTMEHLARLLVEAGVPTEDFLIFQADNDSAERLLATTLFPLVSFTGSKRVGLHLKKTFWDRKVILELGSTAAVVLCDDVPRWELESMSQKLAASAFGQAGQSCISLQHLFLEPENAGDFLSYFKDAASRLAAHWAPSDPETVCCPLVSPAAFDKVSELLADAQAKGATVWRAGLARPDDSYHPPTLVQLPPPAQSSKGFEAIRLLTEEVFGPVACVHMLPAGLDGRSLAARLGVVDANIHASVFTYDGAKAKGLWEQAACHTLLWNEVPSWRADAMPYGGTLGAHAGAVHAGLVGDEGPLYSMQEYTWERLLVLP